MVLKDEMAGVLGLTVRPLKGTDVPFGVTTVALLAPIAAVGAIVRVAEMLVSEALLIAAVTPAPSKVRAVAPLRFVPVIVAETVVPCAADGGDIDVMCGTFVSPTEKPLKGAVTLLLVTILTVR